MGLAWLRRRFRRRSQNPLEGLSLDQMLDVMERVRELGPPGLREPDALDELTDLEDAPPRRPRLDLGDGSNEIGTAPPWSGQQQCPACGSRNVMWGCDDDVTRPPEEIHPRVWHERALMADSYVCRDCNAGWIETEDEPGTWVRPYWRI